VAPKKIPLPAQWAGLLVLSLVFELFLERLHLPAALLLGPMAAAIVFAACGTQIRIPRGFFMSGQAVVGCMIARSITPSILRAMVQDWPIFLAAVVSVIIASNALGWLLAKLRVLPGSTAIWGSAPGGATAMVLMSEAYGADIRLVAFMQYLRVVFVAVVATSVARIYTAGLGAAPATIWFPPIAPLSFVETLALAGLGVAAGFLLRVPAGPLLIPLALGSVLHGVGAMTIELPPWLLAGSYALVGWTIGLRFSRPILVYAARAFPRVATSILVLIALCGGLASLLTSLLHVDPLTAYLATSPGGVDSVAIISTSSPNVNVPFVMAMQTARFLLVIFVGPPIARFVAGALTRPAAVPQE
jgi:uncharacterized protein